LTFFRTKATEFLIRRAVATNSIARKDIVNWEPWSGCYAVSEACRNCYYYGQQSHKTNKNHIVKSTNFDKPLLKTSKGSFKISSGKFVTTCFVSDFFLAEADEWRIKAWAIIKQRPDLTFLILTKRIDRFLYSLPSDWGDGYDNVVIGCTIENQKEADYRLPLFSSFPIKRRFVSCVPLLERVNLLPYLSEIEHITVGGELGRNARECEYDWVLDIREQCISANSTFWFKNTGTRFRRDGVVKIINSAKQNGHARKCGINIDKNMAAKS